VKSRENSSTLLATRSSCNGANITASESFNGNVFSFVLDQSVFFFSLSSKNRIFSLLRQLQAFDKYTTAVSLDYGGNFLSNHITWSIIICALSIHRDRILNNKVGQHEKLAFSSVRQKKFHHFNVNGGIKILFIF